VNVGLNDRTTVSLCFRSLYSLLLLLAIFLQHYYYYCFLIYNKFDVGDLAYNVPFFFPLFIEGKLLMSSQIV
jgi:hypothetical protein